MTIQQKTALIFTTLTGTILVLISAVAYFYMNSFAFMDYYKRLEIRGIVTAKARLEQGHPHGNIYTDLREQHLEALPGEVEYYFAVDSLAGFVKSQAIPRLGGDFYQQVVSNMSANRKVGDMFYTGIIYNYKGVPYVVVVGAQNPDSIAYASKLKLILVLCSLAGIAMAYTLGLFFSRHTFKPVRDIIARVGMVGADNLHLRLEDRKEDDEIAELSSTFNNMLNRLETAFETQNNFVSNASHELRTPLTTIYGEAEVSLSRNRSEEEYRHTLNIILTHAEKLQHLTNSLLNLAQTGFDGKKHLLNPIRIDELLMEVKETINNIIPDNKIHFDFTEIPATPEQLTVKGNYNLLKLGFSNVMENACKYSGNNDVCVKLSIKGKRLSVTVTDKGIGIPDNELKHIYDPFFRASNTGNFEGYGIGLPLTRNIFRLHKGEIHVSSISGKGTRVDLLLPVA